MKIDHIGYAVKNIEKSIVEFKKLVYIFDDIIVDEKRNIYICFGTLDGYRIELVSPYDKNQSSPVDSYVKGNGNTPYHTCYQTNNLVESIKELKEKKFILTIQPEEACAFEGKRVVFMFNSVLGIIEIVENE